MNDADYCSSARMIFVCVDDPSHDSEFDVYSSTHQDLCLPLAISICVHESLITNDQIYFLIGPINFVCLSHHRSTQSCTDHSPSTMTICESNWNTVLLRYEHTWTSILQPFVC